MRVVLGSAKKRVIPRITRRSRYLPETVLTIPAERRLSRARKAIRNGTMKTIPAEEVWRRLGLED